MQRTAQEVANVLSSIYDERFGNDECEQYRLTWADLRLLTGGRKLNAKFIAEINEALEEGNQVLVPFGKYLVLLSETDCSHIRKLNGRLLERYLPDDESEDNDNDDNDEIKDDDEEL